MLAAQRPARQPAHSVASFTSATKSHQPVPLSKRLLFPNIPSNSDLPPLLASSSASPELTAELYDFIALALRAFVTPWWSKITRYDKEFLPEITRILAVVIRALEVRVLATDLSPLVFHDIPTLLTQHYRDYRNAEAKLSTSYANGGAASLPQLFHQLQPHMAVSVDGRIDEEYMRQVVDHILKTCLPPEDYEPEPERFIIREIVLKVVLRDVVPKITQPWFIQRVILDLLGPHEDGPHIEAPNHALSSLPTDASATTSSSSFSFHNLLVLFLSAIQSLSGFCLALIHTYKQAVSTIKLVNQSPLPPSSSVPAPAPTLSPTSSPPHLSPPHPLPPPLPLSREESISPLPSSASSTLSLPLTPPYKEASSSPSSPPPHANYAHPPLTMICEIFMTPDRFASNALMSSIRILATSLAPFPDRLLPHLLQTSLSPRFITQITRIAKGTLFPNGYPQPPPPDPTPEEQARTRETLVGWNAKGGFAHLTPLILGPRPLATLGKALDPLSDPSCNVHLVTLILDRVLVGLFPELGVATGNSGGSPPQP